MVLAGRVEVVGLQRGPRAPRGHCGQRVGDQRLADLHRKQDLVGGEHPRRSGRRSRAPVAPVCRRSSSPRPSQRIAPRWEQGTRSAAGPARRAAPSVRLRSRHLRERETRADDRQVPAGRVEHPCVPARSQGPVALAHGGRSTTACWPIPRTDRRPPGPTAPGRLLRPGRRRHGRCDRPERRVCTRRPCVRATGCRARPRAAGFRLVDRDVVGDLRKAVACRIARPPEEREDVVSLAGAEQVVAVDGNPPAHHDARGAVRRSGPVPSRKRSSPSRMKVEPELELGREVVPDVAVLHGIGVDGSPGARSPPRAGT